MRVKIKTVSSKRLSFSEILHHWIRSPDVMLVVDQHMLSLVLPKLNRFRDCHLPSHPDNLRRRASGKVFSPTEPKCFRFRWIYFTKQWRITSKLRLQDSTRRCDTCWEKCKHYVQGLKSTFVICLNPPNIHCHLEKILQTLASPGGWMNSYLLLLQIHHAYSVD